MTSVEAVLLDIDDTILEYRRKTGDLLPISFERVGVEPFFTVEEYHDRYSEFAEESENMLDLRERVFAAFASERGHDPEVGREVARAYDSERDHGNVRFLTGAREAVETLAERGPLAAVTNGAPEMQSKKLASLDIHDHFDAIVYAGYDAPAKPDPAPFNEVLDTLDVSPEQTIHVGNSLTSDVAGAKNAGVRAAWLANGSEVTPDSESPEPDYVLTTMAELPDLLD
jgi:HAD superfamily hydrolase (TIGR01549 family)